MSFEKSKFGEFTGTNMIFALLDIIHKCYIIAGNL